MRGSTIALVMTVFVVLAATAAAQTPKTGHLTLHAVTIHMKTIGPGVKVPTAYVEKVGSLVCSYPGRNPNTREHGIYVKVSKTKLMGIRSDDEQFQDIGQLDPDLLRKPALLLIRVKPLTVGDKIVFNVSYHMRTGASTQDFTSKLSLTCPP